MLVFATGVFYVLFFVNRFANLRKQVQVVVSSEVPENNTPGLERFFSSVEAAVDAANFYQLSSVFHRESNGDIPNDYSEPESIRKLKSSFDESIFVDDGDDDDPLSREMPKSPRYRITIS